MTDPLDPAAVFEHAGVGIAMLDRRGLVLSANPWLRAMLGRSNDELAGRSLAPHVDGGEGGATHEQVLADLERRGGSRRELERRYRTARGEIIDVREVVSVVPGAGAVLFLEDVTARRREERERRAQMCLTHLGEMASVVAHEVRNALAGVGSAVEVIGQGFGAGSEERLAVDEVRKRVTDLSEMARGLVRMARARPLRRSPISVRVLLAEVERSLADRDGPMPLAVSGADGDVGADVDLLALALVHLIAPRAQVGAPARVSVRTRPGSIELRIDGGGAPAPEQRSSARVDLDVSLTRCIIEAHGGVLAFADRAAVVTLPRAGWP